MAHLQVAEIDVEGFKFVSFKERSEDMRKLTRKRHLEDIERNGSHPPEGHLMFCVKEFGSSEENDKGDDDTTNFSVRSFYLGGALNSAGATWSFASSRYVAITKRGSNQMVIRACFRICNIAR